MHLNTNKRDVNHSVKQQLQPNCISRNAYDTYDTAIMVITLESRVKNALYTNKYDKCSCREKLKCPLMNLCMSTNLVYRCTVHIRRGPYIYIRQAAALFKNWYCNHFINFKTINMRHSTSLAIFVWWQKEDKTKCSITWSIVRHAKNHALSFPEDAVSTPRNPWLFWRVMKRSLIGFLKGSQNA